MAAWTTVAETEMETERGVGIQIRFKVELKRVVNHLNGMCDKGKNIELVIMNKVSILEREVTRKV